MRGKGFFAHMRTYVRRITPAHAGKRNSMIKKDAPERDHPRPCGEKVQLNNIASQGEGSPPPMRGKAQDAAGIIDDTGITPAHAGKRV